MGPPIAIRHGGASIGRSATNDWRFHLSISADPTIGSRRAFLSLQPIFQIQQAEPTRFTAAKEKCHMWDS